MKNDMKRIILILAFILCFGISACGRGSSDGYDAEDSEDHRGSGENESVVYGSTDDGQDKESAEIDKDNPAKQLGYSSIEEMCRWGEAEERRNAGYGRTKIVMQIIKSNVRRKV